MSSQSDPILLITSSYPRNATETTHAGVFVYHFAKNLATHNPIAVVTTQAFDNSPLPVHAIASLPSKVPLTEIKASTMHGLSQLAFVMMAGFFTCLRQTWKLKPRHILACWALPCGIWALLCHKLTGTPYSIWLLGSDVWKVDSYPLGRFIFRRVLAEASAVYADGFVLADEAKAIAPKATISFLASTRQLNRDLINETAPAAIVANKINMVFIGRFHPHKGIDFLLNSLGELQHRQRYHFHIFGGGPLDAEVKRLADSLGNGVTVHGYADESATVNFLHYCHCLIIPSRAESLPVVLSDAMQMACPVIVSRVGDMGTLVDRYGIGQAFEKENTAALCHAIEAMARRDKASFTAALQEAMKTFDLQQSVATFLKNT